MRSVAVFTGIAVPVATSTQILRKTHYVRKRKSGFFIIEIISQRI